MFDWSDRRITTDLGFNTQVAQALLVVNRVPETVGYNIGAVVLVFSYPLALLLYIPTVYVVLIMDADSGAVASTALSTLGAGLATALLTVFTAIGSFVGAVRWYKSQR